MDNEIDGAVAVMVEAGAEQALAKRWRRRLLKKSGICRPPVLSARPKPRLRQGVPVSVGRSTDRPGLSPSKAKECNLTRRLEKKMLNRLQRTTGSCFFGPGMGVRKNVKNIRSSGSAVFATEDPEEAG